MATTSLLTYTACKSVINNTIYRSQNQKDEMQQKLDVFLLGERLTVEQYEELTELLHNKPIEGGNA